MDFQVSGVASATLYEHIPKQKNLDLKRNCSGMLQYYLYV